MQHTQILYILIKDSPDKIVQMNIVYAMCTTSCKKQNTPASSNLQEDMHLYVVVHYFIHDKDSFWGNGVGKQLYLAMDGTKTSYVWYLWSAVIIIWACAILEFRHFKNNGQLLSMKAVWSTLERKKDNTGISLCSRSDIILLYIFTHSESLIHWNINNNNLF